MKSAIFAASCALAAALGAHAGERADGRDVRRTPTVLAVERSAPATVNITTTQRIQPRQNPFFRRDPLFEQFFGRFIDPRPRESRTLGTGAIISADGYVLTNEHVLAGATEISVMLADGREFDAELIGSDPDTDLAVIKLLTREPVPAVAIGSSSDLMIGETVIAIGNPFGLHHTVTTGVLSAINRSIQDNEAIYHGLIQTDASINPGNSGGPLLNLNGEVIGINTAIFRDAEGIGFAIPIDRARKIAKELIEHGAVSPVWLGVRVQSLTPRLRAALGVHAEQGALVSHVFAGSPAERAGLRRGDLIEKMAGTPLVSQRTYFEILRGIPAGDSAYLRIERARERLEIDVAVVAFPQSRADDLAGVMLGFSVGESRDAPGLEIRTVAPEGSADRVGLRPGDVLLKLDRATVDDRGAFRRAISKLRGRRQVLLLVQRGQRGYQLTLRIS